LVQTVENKTRDETTNYLSCNDNQQPYHGGGGSRCRLAVMSGCTYNDRVYDKNIPNSSIINNIKKKKTLLLLFFYIM
jgi:hypothetical protein